MIFTGLVGHGAVAASFAAGARGAALAAVRGALADGFARVAAAAGATGLAWGELAGWVAAATDTAHRRAARARGTQPENARQRGMQGSELTTS
ncbi:MAG TPA: hypothetical protein VGJ35_06110 [Burkholderiaceae bacterium]|jgi:hypothetical protein